MYKLDLRKWQLPQEKELLDTRVASYYPSYHTGLKVWCWGGWTWHDQDTEYRTDSQGNGLWLWSTHKLQWEQIRGTCQFGLPENRQACIRKLRRLGYGIRKVKHAK